MLGNFSTKKNGGLIFFFKIVLSRIPSQGQIQDFWKGVHMYKVVGVPFADFNSFFLNIP